MSNKDQAYQVLQMIKEIKKDGGWSNIGKVRMYVDSGHWDMHMNVGRWFWALEFDGLELSNHGLDTHPMNEKVDLTPWFDAIKEEFKPYMPSTHKMNVDLEIITVNGKKYKAIED